MKKEISYQDILDSVRLTIGSYFFPVEIYGEPDDHDGVVILAFENGHVCLGESIGETLKVFGFKGDELRSKSRLVAWMPRPKYDKSRNIALKSERTK